MALKLKLAVLCVFALSIQAFAYASDDRIANDITAAVASLDGIKPYTLKVEVSGGEVTLIGKVPTEKAKRQIEAAASSVPGVGKIKDNLVVTRRATDTESFEDSALCESARSNLAQTRKADDFNVILECQGADVTLSGTAATDTDIAEIERVIRSMPGVGRVINQVRLLPEVGDPHLDKAIYDQLTRQGVHLGSVKYTVRNGIVTFTGHVAEHEEIDRILAGTLMVKGVKDVQSEVTIGQ